MPERAPWSEKRRLRDGSPVWIRQVSPADKDALAAAVSRLSPESRYRRFLSAVDHLSDRQLDYLTKVDHTDHEALVAIEPGQGLVGIGRYVRGADPEAAEVALTVTDDWQGRGVGTALLDALVERARDAGIKRFIALCRSDNKPSVEVLEAMGKTSSRSFPERGLIDLEIELPERGEGRSALHEVLGHSARGELAIQESRTE